MLLLESTPSVPDEFVPAPPACATRSTGSGERCGLGGFDGAREQVGFLDRHAFPHPPVHGLASDGVAAAQVVPTAVACGAPLAPKTGVQHHALPGIVADSDNIRPGN